MFPHVNPETAGRSPLWLRAGKFDVVAIHDSGRTRVIEHKTTVDPIEASTAYWETLLLDTQISQYVLACESMYGLKVDECVYDVLRKFGIQPLKATPREKWRYKNRTKQQLSDGLPADDPSLLYANIRTEDETPDEFYERCKEQTRDRDQHWHRMEVISRTDSMLEDHRRNAWVTSKMMRQDERMGWAMKNPDACHRFGVCPFWHVCTHQTTLDDPLRYERLDTLHPELDLEDIESK